MGRRSRKRRPAGASAPAPVPPAADEAPRASRSEQRHEEIRQGLEPLAPGERPKWVTVAAVVALALGALNIGLYAAGVRAAGGTPEGTIGVGAILLVCAYGMWRARYWAVLGFQTLLAITAIYSGLSLGVASSVAGAIRATLVFLGSSFLFWKLIRAMARLQMPRR